MIDNELLLAMSEMLDEKPVSELKPIKNDLASVKLTLENNIVPRLQNIEFCYISTYERYKNHADKMESVFTDVELLKKVVSDFIISSPLTHSV